MEHIPIVVLRNGELLGTYHNLQELHRYMKTRFSTYTDRSQERESQRNIEVWVGGIFESVGKVESFTADTVTIDGNHFLRANCVFWIV